MFTLRKSKTMCGVRSIPAPPRVSACPEVRRQTRSNEIYPTAAGVFHRSRRDRQHHLGLEARQHFAARHLDGHISHRARTRRAAVPAPSRARVVADARGPNVAARDETAIEASGGTVFGRGR